MLSVRKLTLTWINRAPAAIALILRHKNAKHAAAAKPRPCPGEGEEKSTR